MQKVINFLKSISVEPIILLFITAATLHGNITRYGIYQVVCKQLTGTECSEMGLNDALNRSKSNLEEIAQRITADYQTYCTISYVIPSIFADLLMGAWGDKAGRQYNILIGIFGWAMIIIPHIILFIYPKTTPLYILLIGNIIGGMTDFWTIVIVSSFAYVADTVVDKELLTVRMGIIQVMVNTGAIFGPLVGSGLSKIMTIAYQEIVVLGIHTVNFGLVCVILRQKPPLEMRKLMEKRNEKSNPDPLGKLAGQDNFAMRSGSHINMSRANGIAHKRSSSDNLSSKDTGPSMRGIDSISRTRTHSMDITPSVDSVPRTENGPPIYNTPVPNRPSVNHALATVTPNPSQNPSKKNVGKFQKYPCVDLGLSTITLLKSVWCTYTKKRAGHKRIYLWITVSIFFLAFFAEAGLRYGLMGLYLQLSPMDWDQAQLGYYDSTHGIGITVGMIISTIFLKRILHLSDTTLILISLLSCSAEMFMIAFAHKTYMMFISTGLALFSYVYRPCCKSFVAKLVDADEVGKAYILFGISQNVALFISFAFFNNIYKASLQVFHALAFVISAVIFGLAFLLALCVHVDNKKSAKIQ